MSTKKGDPGDLFQIHLANSPAERVWKWETFNQTKNIKQLQKCGDEPFNFICIIIIIYTANCGVPIGAKGMRHQPPLKKPVKISDICCSSSNQTAVSMLSSNGESQRFSIGGPV